MEEAGASPRSPEGSPLLDPAALVGEAAFPEAAEPRQRAPRGLRHFAPLGRRPRCGAAVAFLAVIALSGLVALALQAPAGPGVATVADAIEAQETPCGRPALGDHCYQAVRWARDFDILVHPGWYEGLTRLSSFDAFQAHLARKKPAYRCPRPCLEQASAGANKTVSVEATASAAIEWVSWATTTTATTTTESITTTSTTVTSGTSTFTTGTTLPALSSATSADVAQFYLYRAQSPDDYPFENVNAADLGGVLWYLQNEVLGMCPRKNNISRVIRHRVTTRKHLMPYVAFDMAKCTVPKCWELWAKWGYRIGCQQLGDYGQIKSHWYSLPGPCPSQFFPDKKAACLAAELGGRCARLQDVYEPGTSGCTYYTEWAGDVDISEVTGIGDYDSFCRRGGIEYDHGLDRGTLMNFWDGLSDTVRCALRKRKFEESFLARYPKLPASMEMPLDTECR